MDVSWNSFMLIPNIDRWICLEVESHVLCIDMSIVRSARVHMSFIYVWCTLY